ncbi:hypothetical protein GW17_00046864 [Ensete ventricosum]|nr:hypothetical protein GW17_00046864 [Ensete ventricosum]
MDGHQVAPTPTSQALDFLAAAATDPLLVFFLLLQRRRKAWFQVLKRFLTTLMLHLPAHRPRNKLPLSAACKELAYWKEMEAPGARGRPSLTRQSLMRRRRKMRGLMRRVELNAPQLRWMRPMAQPFLDEQRFSTVTVYVGIPLGSGGVAPWFTSMSSTLHRSPVRSVDGDANDDELAPVTWIICHDAIKRIRSPRAGGQLLRIDSDVARERQRGGGTRLVPAVEPHPVVEISTTRSVEHKREKRGAGFFLFWGNIEPLGRTGKEQSPSAGVPAIEGEEACGPLAVSNGRRLGAEPAQLRRRESVFVSVSLYYTANKDEQWVINLMGGAAILRPETRLRISILRDVWPITSYRHRPTLRRMSECFTQTNGVHTKTFNGSDAFGQLASTFRADHYPRWFPGSHLAGLSLRSLALYRVDDAAPSTIGDYRCDYRHNPWTDVAWFYIETRPSTRGGGFVRRVVFRVGPETAPSPFEPSKPRRNLTMLGRSLTLVRRRAPRLPIPSSPPRFLSGSLDPDLGLPDEVVAAAAKPTPPPIEPSAEADALARLLLQHHNPFHAMESPLQLAGVGLSDSLVLQTLLRLRHASKVALGFFVWARDHAHHQHASDAYGLMVDILGRVRQFDVAWQMIIEMDQRGVGPTPTTFAVLVRRYVAAGMARQAVRTFDDMEAFVGREPNGEEFKMLLDTLCKYGYTKVAAEHRGVIHAYLELYRSSLGYRAPVGDDAPLPVHRSDGAAVDGFDAAEAVAPQHRMGLRAPRTPVSLPRSLRSDAPPHAAPRPASRCRCV